MQTLHLTDNERRSPRVPLAMAIRVTSLRPETKFSEVCETLVVNAHGCALRSPIKLDAGIPLQFRNKEGREATARVVACLPMENDNWKLGVVLERPENFWGLRPCPEEWDRVIEMPSPASATTRKHSPGNGEAGKPRGPVPPALQTAFDKIERQLSDEHLKSLLSQLVQPLNTEVLELRDRLAKSARQNRFEVSLSQIPPELEEQLWSRLRQDLGAQALHQAREQATQVLGTANASIEQKIAGAMDEFRQRLIQELQSVERRANALSQEMTETAQQHQRSELEKFQQQVLDAGSSLDRRSEKLLKTLQQSLSDDYHSYRREVEQIQATVEAKSTQLESQISDLGIRTGRLNESVRKLETELDAHLEKLASEIVAAARSRLETAANAVLKDLQTRGTQDLDRRIEAACDRLKAIQVEIEAASAEALKASVADSLQAFDQTMEEMAQHSVGRWRLALSRDLASVATTLGKHIRSEAMCDPDDES